MTTITAADSGDGGGGRQKQIDVFVPGQEDLRVFRELQEVSGEARKLQIFIFNS